MTRGVYTAVLQRGHERGVYERHLWGSWRREGGIAMKMWLAVIMAVLILVAVDITVRIGWDSIASVIGSFVERQRQATQVKSEPPTWGEPETQGRRPQSAYTVSGTPAVRASALAGEAAPSAPGQNDSAPIKAMKAHALMRLAGPRDAPVDWQAQDDPYSFGKDLPGGWFVMCMPDMIEKGFFTCSASKLMLYVAMTARLGESTQSGIRWSVQSVPSHSAPPLPTRLCIDDRLLVLFGPPSPPGAPRSRSGSCTDSHVPTLWPHADRELISTLLTARSATLDVLLDEPHRWTHQTISLEGFPEAWRLMQTGMAHQERQALAYSPPPMAKSLPDGWRTDCLDNVQNIVGNLHCFVAKESMMITRSAQPPGISIGFAEGNTYRSIALRLDDDPRVYHGKTGEIRVQGVQAIALVARIQTASMAHLTVTMGDIPPRLMDIPLAGFPEAWRMMQSAFQEHIGASASAGQASPVSPQLTQDTPQAPPPPLPDVTSPTEVVRQYYADLTRHDVEAAKGKWKTPPPRLQDMLQQVDWYRVDDLTLLRSEATTGQVQVLVTGKRLNQEPEQWSGTIDVAQSAGAWKIVKMNLAKQ